MKFHLILAATFLAALSPLALTGAQTQSKQAAKQPAPAARSSAPRSSAAGNRSASQNSSMVQSGTNISAELLTSLDVRHAKPGQKVVAKVTRDVKQDGHTVIRKGSRLVGHVVAAQAGANANAASRMEVSFDQLLQGRSTTALNTVVTSIVSVPRAPEPEPMPMPMEAPEPAPMSGPAPAGGRVAGGGGLAGGAVGSVGSTVGSVGSVGSSVGSTVGAAGQVAGNAGSIGGNAAGMGRGAAGVTGNAIRVSSITGANSDASAGMSNRLANASLGSSAGAANRTGATSVFTSPRRNLNLHSGTQLQMQVVGSAQAHPPTRH